MSLTFFIGPQVQFRGAVSVMVLLESRFPMTPCSQTNVNLQTSTLRFIKGKDNLKSKIFPGLIFYFNLRLIF